VAGALHYAWFWTGIYGAPAQIGAYGGVPEDASGSPFQAVLGLLFDRAYGVIPIAPVLALGALLAASAVRRGGGVASPTELFLVAAVLAPILPWRMWWGGQCPPGRFLVPVIPFVALWCARAFRTARPRRAVSLGIAAAVVAGWALFLFAALQPHRLLFINRRQGPTRLWDALWPGGPLGDLWPDLARPEAADWTLGVVWFSAAAAAVLAAWFATPRVRSAVRAE
jgi:hypothetical protein